MDDKIRQIEHLTKRIKELKHLIFITKSLYKKMELQDQLFDAVDDLKVLQDKGGEPDAGSQKRT